MIEKPCRCHTSRIGMLRAIDRNVERIFNPDRKGHALGKAEAKKGQIGQVGAELKATNKGAKSQRADISLRRPVDSCLCGVFS
jgi:hypothetical protein